MIFRWLILIKQIVMNVFLSFYLFVCCVRWSHNMTCSSIINRISLYFRTGHDTIRHDTWHMSFTLFMMFIRMMMLMVYKPVLIANDMRKMTGVEQQMKVKKEIWGNKNSIRERFLLMNIRTGPRTITFIDIYA